jgi:uncharacterized Zn finger protein
MQPTNDSSAPQCPKCSGADLKLLKQTERPGPVAQSDANKRLTTLYECSGCGTVFAEAR